MSFVAAGLGVALVPALALGFLHDGVRVKPVRGVQPVRQVCAAVRSARAGEEIVQGAVKAPQDAAACVRNR